MNTPSVTALRCALRGDGRGEDDARLLIAGMGDGEIERLDEAADLLITLCRDELGRRHS